MFDLSSFKRVLSFFAHPDDEILWFGSIVDDVDHIIAFQLTHRVAQDLGLQRFDHFVADTP